MEKEKLSKNVENTPFLPNKVPYSTLEVALANILLEIKRIDRDFVYFVNNYCYIEDPDAEGRVVPFKLWKEQVKVANILPTNRLCLLLKSRQTGGTWLALCYATWRLIRKSGYSVGCISKREDPDGKEMVRRVEFILRHLPKWLVRHKSEAHPNYNGALWESTVFNIYLNHKNGERSTLSSFASTPECARTFTMNLIILDEWAWHPFAKEIWTAVFPTVNRPTGGQVIGISSGRPKTLFEEILGGAMRGENDFKWFFFDVWTDPRRTREWYRKTLNVMGKVGRREYPETIADAFSAGGGSMFDNWDERIHVRYDKSWYPPENWKLFRAYDPGYHKAACCKWYALSPDGELIGYREYYPTKVTDIEQARAIIHLSRKPNGENEKIEYTVAGHDAWKKQGAVGVSTADTFMSNGIPLILASTDRRNGWKRLYEWLRIVSDKDGNPTSLLAFTPACYNTIRTYPTLEMDKNDPEDMDTDGEDHCADTDRYMVMSRPSFIGASAVVPEVKPENLVELFKKKINDYEKKKNKQNDREFKFILENGRYRRV